MEPWNPDHRGLWAIMPPADMPLAQITMLQTTIAEAWQSYGGERDNAEQFFNHLVGNGMADVPRETSPVPRPSAGQIWRAVDDEDDKVEIIFIGGTDRYGPDPVTYRHTNCPCRLQAHALKNHQSVRPMPSFLGLYEPDDVPRETSPYEVDAVYRVNDGALRTAQRTVDAWDWVHAMTQVKTQIHAAMRHDDVTFIKLSGGIVPDGGPIVADVPRETSAPDPVIVEGYNEQGQKVEITLSRKGAQRWAAKAAHPHDMFEIKGVYVRADALVGALAEDVPRETSERQS